MSNDSSIMSLKVDGVLLQYAGELLFDTEITTYHRRRFAGTYKKSLSDLTYAILYHERLFASGNIPPSGSTNPAKEIVSAFATCFGEVEKVLNESPERVVRPEELLSANADRDADRNEISALVSAVVKSYDRNPNYWESFVLREGTIFLGTHLSLEDDTLEPSEYIFSKNPAYCIDRNIQNQIAPRVIVNLAKILSETELVKAARIKDKALQEFVSRVVLTHFVIHWWGTVVGDSNLPWRLAHVTRTSVDHIRITEKAHQSEKAMKHAVVQPIRSRFNKIITRHGLFDALSTPDISSREELAEYLLVLRHLEPYKSLRRMLVRLEEAEKEATGKSQVEIVKILNEIRRISGSSAELLDEVHLSQTLNEYGAPTHSVIREIGLGYKKSAGPAYEASLYRIFPELVADSR